MDLADKLKHVPSVASIIADTIAELIYSAELKPGQFLRQEALSQQFGVSRVPVRDALHVLQQQGLVVSVPRRGVMVRPVTRKAVRDFYELRRAVEPFIARKVCACASPQDIEALGDLIDQHMEAAKQNNWSQALKIDEQFHFGIAGLADNEELYTLIVGVWARLRQIRSIVRADAEWAHLWAHHSIERHRQILAALKGGDPEAAAQVVDQVICESEKELTMRFEALKWFQDQDGQE
ncbi:MAG TPA: GntR family transcriptional regulator [Firmicutes bacterium]|nr:GntR family transcriptional regulator [Bacillota bacterium]